METVECVLLAAFGGLLASAANNVVAYFHHKAEKNNKEIGRCENVMLVVVNIVFNLLTVACFLAASSHGPVALAMPLVTAFNLLSNMIFQFSQGIAKYTKPMRVGTCILVAATVCLITAGPADSNQGVDLSALLSSHLARLWLEVLVLNLLAWMIVLRHTEARSTKEMFCLSLIVSISTALGASVGKALSVVNGLALWTLLGVYIGLGLVSFAYGASAAFSCDMSIYLPLSQCLQLMVNCLTGVFVWGDGPRIQDGLVYVMVYVLILMGVYLCSSYDYYAETKHAVEQIHEHTKGTRIGKYLTASKKANVGNTFRAWALSCEAEQRAPKDMLVTLSEQLTNCRSMGQLDYEGLQQICLLFLEDLLTRGASLTEIQAMLPPPNRSHSEACTSQRQSAIHSMPSTALLSQDSLVSF